MNVSDLVDLSFSSRFVTALGHFLWQGCLIALLAVLGDWLLSRASASYRYAVNVAAMSIMVACVPITYSLIDVPDTVESITTTTVANTVPLVAMDVDQTSSMPLAISPTSGDTESMVPDFSLMAADVQVGNFPVIDLVQPADKDGPLRELLQWSPQIAVLYFSCCGLLLARLIHGASIAHRLRRGAVAVSDGSLLATLQRQSKELGLRYYPPIAWCADVSIPLVVGVLKPMILLPTAAATGLSPDQVEALITHELAHIRRYDLLVNVVQRVVESLLFFHPAVWFISRRISSEREHACDELVLASGFERLCYADALVCMAELSWSLRNVGTSSPATSLAATGANSSEFKRRVLKVMSVQASSDLRPSRISLLAIVALIVGATVSASRLGLDAFADAPPDVTESTDSETVEWGESTNGLRSRIVPVLSSMSEDKIDPAQRVVKFAELKDVAFAVELENVSDKPIQLIDTRYGNSYGDSKGKANSNWYGQFLFSIDLFDRNGKLIERPEVQIVDLNGVLSGAMVAPLEPGQMHRFLLRPAKWMSAMTQRLDPGNYHAAVTYHGLPKRVATRIKEYRADSVVLGAVEGDIVSPQVAFEVLPPQSSDRQNDDEQADAGKSELVWGEPSDGLRAAMSFLPAQAQYSHSEKPDTKLHVQNVSDKSIILTSHLWMSDLRATVKDVNDKTVTVDGRFYSGVTLTSRVTLKPKQIVLFDAGNLGLAITKERAGKFEHVTHRTLVAPAGEYSIQLEGRFGGSFSLKDGKGKILAPLEGDWSGKLTTGETLLTITNESIKCDVVDSVTGKPVAGTTVNFRFIKPESGDSPEEAVADIFWIHKAPSQIRFSIPDMVLQRADRDEIEVQWSVGQHSDYEPFAPVERIPLKLFFHEGTNAAREILSTIRLTPKLKKKSTASLARAAVDFKVNPLATVVQPLADGARVDASGELMPAGMVQRLGSTRFKVPGWWRRLAFAGDDEWIWIKADSRVSAIHRRTGRVVNHHQLRLGEGWVHSLTASADGTLVAIAMLQPPFPKDGGSQVSFRVVVMAASTTEHLQDLKWKGRSGELNCLSFSADGKTLLAGTHHGDIRLWDVETGEQMRQLSLDEKSRFRFAAMSPDGRSAVFGGRGMSFYWKFASQAGPIKLESRQGDSVSFAPNGRLFSTIGRDGVRLWNAENGELITKLKSEEYENYDDADFGHSFTPNSRLLAVPLNAYDVVELWDVESKQRVATLPVHEPRGVAISSDGRWLAASGNEFATTIFDLKTRKTVSQPGDGHAEEVLSMSFSGNQTLVSSSRGDAIVWDIQSGQQKHKLSHETKSTTVRGLATSPDGSLIVTSGFDDTLGVWERATGKRLFTLQGHGEIGGMRAVQFKPDGSQFVSWGDDGMLRWWNTKDGSLAAMFAVDVPGYADARENEHFFTINGALAPDANSLFVVFKSQLFEFDTQTGKRLRQIPVDRETTPLTVSPDGRWIAAGEGRRDQDGQATSAVVVLRDRATLKVVREWPVRNPRPPAANAEDPKQKRRIATVGHNGLAFSPDSQFLAWSRIDSQSGIDIAEITSNPIRGSIPVESLCRTLKFSPDGNRIASGHADSTISVWDLSHFTLSLLPPGR